MPTCHKCKRWDSLHRYQSERSSCSSGKVPPSALALYPVYSYQRLPSDLQAENALLCQADRSAPLDLVMISPGVPKTRITSARARTKRVRTPKFVMPGIVSYPCHSNKSEKKPGYAHRQAIAVSRKCRIGSTSSWACGEVLLCPLGVMSQGLFSCCCGSLITSEGLGAGQRNQ